MAGVRSLLLGVDPAPYGLGGAIFLEPPGLCRGSGALPRALPAPSSLISWLIAKQTMPRAGPDRGGSRSRCTSLPPGPGEHGDQPGCTDRWGGPQLPAGTRKGQSPRLGAGGAGAAGRGERVQGHHKPPGPRSPVSAHLPQSCPQPPPRCKPRYLHTGLGHPPRARNAPDATSERGSICSGR